MEITRGQEDLFQPSRGGAIIPVRDGQVYFPDLEVYRIPEESDQEHRQAEGDGQGKRVAQDMHDLFAGYRICPVDIEAVHLSAPSTSLIKTSSREGLISKCAA